MHNATGFLVSDTHSWQLKHWLSMVVLSKTLTFLELLEFFCFTQESVFFWYDQFFGICDTNGFLSMQSWFQVTCSSSICFWRKGVNMTNVQRTHGEANTVEAREKLTRRHGTVAKCMLRAWNSLESEPTTFIWLTQQRPCWATPMRLINTECCPVCPCDVRKVKNEEKCK